MQALGKARLIRKRKILRTKEPSKNAAPELIRGGDLVHCTNSLCPLYRLPSGDKLPVRRRVIVLAWWLWIWIGILALNVIIFGVLALIWKIEDKGVRKINEQH